MRAGVEGRPVNVVAVLLRNAGIVILHPAFHLGEDGVDEFLMRLHLRFEIRILGVEIGQHIGIGDIRITGIAQPRVRILDRDAMAREAVRHTFGNRDFRGTDRTCDVISDAMLRVVQGRSRSIAVTRPFSIAKERRPDFSASAFSPNNRGAIPSAPARRRCRRRRDVRDRRRSRSPWQQRRASPPSCEEELSTVRQWPSRSAPACCVRSTAAISDRVRGLP